MKGTITVVNIRTMVGWLYDNLSISGSHFTSTGTTVAVTILNLKVSGSPLSGSSSSPLWGLSHMLRHSTEPRTPSVNSYFMRQSFSYQGPKLWASLHDCLNDSRTKSLFKTPQNERD